MFRVNNIKNVMVIDKPSSPYNTSIILLLVYTVTVVIFRPVIGYRQGHHSYIVQHAESLLALKICCSTVYYY